MRVCLVFHPTAWEEPAAVFSIETVATLLELPWRSTVLGREIGADEAPVFVGPASGAPEGVAAVIPCEGWPGWDLAALRLARFEDAHLVCPRGEYPEPRSERELPAPWLRSIGFMLCRDEELLDARRDQWECFSGFYSRIEDLGVLDRPLVNLHARQLRRRVDAWCERRGATIEAEPLWKDGARFAVALTHDVDDIRLYSLEHAWRLLRQARDPSSYAFRAGVGTLARTLRRGLEAGDPYWNFDRWLAEEGRLGFRSTFYFCPPEPRHRHEYDATYHTRDRVEFEGKQMPLARMMSTMAERGWEIGLHGSYESYQDTEELLRQRRQIEQGSGRSIAGIRQHFLRFDVRTTWTAQERAGFEYDTTLGFNEAVGFRAGIAAPFHPWNVERRAAHEILELPLSVMDGCLFRTLKLDAAQAARLVREHLQEVEKVGGLAVLLWHPNAADEEHFPGWWSSYRETLDYLATRPAWVTTADEIAQWWRTRAKALGSGAAATSESSRAR